MYCEKIKGILMRKEEVAPYLGTRVKVILKGSGNIYTGVIQELMDSSFVIFDKYNDKVTIDYELCGLIVPL